MTRRGGFSLLELVVAIAILTVGMLGVLRAVQQSSNAQAAAADRTAAMELCEQKLAELQLDPELEPGRDEGDFGDEYPKFRWTSVIEQTELDGLLRLTVTVSWRSGARDHSVDLHTCFAPDALIDDPAETGPTGTELPADEAAAEGAQAPTGPADLAGGLPGGLPAGGGRSR